MLAIHVLVLALILLSLIGLALVMLTDSWDFYESDNPTGPSANVDAEHLPQDPEATCQGTDPHLTANQIAVGVIPNPACGEWPSLSELVKLLDFIAMAIQFVGAVVTAGIMIAGCLAGLGGGLIGILIMCLQSYPRAAAASQLIGKAANIAGSSAAILSCVDAKRQSSSDPWWAVVKGCYFSIGIAAAGWVVTDPFLDLALDGYAVCIDHGYTDWMECIGSQL